MKPCFLSWVSLSFTQVGKAVPAALLEPHCEKRKHKSSLRRVHELKSSHRNCKILMCLRVKSPCCSLSYRHECD